MTIRLGHFGSYDINIGDNIALYNVREAVNKYIDNIEWISINLALFIKKNNNSDFTINYINKLKLNGLIIGGGGLIEVNGFGNGWNNLENKFKLPFSKTVFDKLNCKVYCVSLGINLWRNFEKNIDIKTVKSLFKTIDKSSLFSLRNDGSYPFLKNKLLKNTKNITSDQLLSYSNMITNKNIFELPDPGLLCNFPKKKVYNINNIVFQIALNKCPDVNKSRCGDDKYNIYLNKLKTFINDNNLKILPHTPKDYLLKDFKDYLIMPYNASDYIFSNTIDFIKKYYIDYMDAIVAMRGHGQLISIGLNIPGIYFSTQDKVEQFSLLNGFKDYNVDVREDNWELKLQIKLDMLKNNKEYLDNWYKIRDENMIKWNLEFNQYIEQLVNKLELNNQE